MAKAGKDSTKLVANNKKAYHDYFIEDTYEAGIALFGTEVKSLRMGKCSIKESFRKWTNPGLWKAGLLCGIALFCAASFQQVGLVYTDAGKAGFITAMYIIGVPLQTRACLGG